MRSLMVISFVVSLVFAGCSRAELPPAPSGDVKGTPGAPGAPAAPGASGSPAAGTTTLAPLSIDDAEAFVTSWCGSGTLTNLRQLDAADYADFFVADVDTNWSLAIKDWRRTNSSILSKGWLHRDRELAKKIERVKESRFFKAMFPTGKMILVDFSSGSGCRKTSIVIDALAASYLKKLKDASSANALTCEKKSQGGFHRLVFKVPAISGVLNEGDPAISGCHNGIAVTFVGHASTGTMALVSESAFLMGDRLIELGLRSFIFEADGSASFMRSDGVFKSYIHTFTEPDESLSASESHSRSRAD